MFTMPPNSPSAVTASVATKPRTPSANGQESVLSALRIAFINEKVLARLQATVARRTIRLYDAAETQYSRECGSGWKSRPTAQQAPAAKKVKVRAAHPSHAHAEALHSPSTGE